MRLLDPHSNYISPDDLESENLRDQNIYKNTGAVFKLDLVDRWRPFKALVVDFILPDSPAEDFLQVGDAIVALHGHALQGLYFHNVQELLNRDPNKLVLRKKGEDQQIGLEKLQTKNACYSCRDIVV